MPSNVSMDRLRKIDRMRDALNAREGALLRLVEDVREEQRRLSLYALSVGKFDLTEEEHARTEERVVAALAPLEAGTIPVEPVPEPAPDEELDGAGRVIVPNPPGRGRL